MGDAGPIKFEMAAFGDFKSAVAAALHHLRSAFQLDDWVLAFLQDQKLTVLQLDAGATKLSSIESLPWADAICRQLRSGGDGFAAVDTTQAPALAELAKPDMQTAAAVGVPLQQPDGMFVGALCGFARAPQPAALQLQLPLFQLMARLLGTILSRELTAVQSNREIEQRRTQALRDELTNLHNRRGFEELTVLEERRCRRYGHSACALVVDLNDLKKTNDHLGHRAGDELISRAAEAIRRAARNTDITGRVGGDEFQIIAIECDESGGMQLVDRLRENLTQLRVSAAIGMACRSSVGSLEGALMMADARMYHDKRRQKAGRSNAA